MAHTSKDMYRVPGQESYKGIQCAKNTPASMFEKLRTFTVRDGDVFVACYPRSGTTWSQEIVWLILNDGDTDAAKKSSTLERVPYLEVIVDGVSGLDIADKMPSPRVVKTHAPLSLMPSQLLERESKTVVCIRNPKDVAVSFYHFYRASVGFGPFPGTWDEFYQMFVSGEILYGPWFDHVKSWWSVKSDPKIMLIYYEELIKDLRGHITKIAEFLGKKLKTETIDKIVRACSFKEMQLDMNKYLHEWEMGKDTLVRKGTVGDWKNYFTVAQNEDFDNVYAREMAGTDIPLPFCPINAIN